MIATLQAGRGAGAGARAVVVGFALRRARQLAGLRELPKYLLGARPRRRARRSWRWSARPWPPAGGSARADDVFFLDLPEARRRTRRCRPAALVEQRRRAYDQELRRRHLPRLLLSDGTEPEALVPRASADGALRRHARPRPAR